MKNFLQSLFLGLLLLSFNTLAHGPTPQKIDERIIIQTSVDEVWQIVSEFGALAEWHPLVSAAESLEPGTRKLTLDKGSITESLDEKDDEQHVIGYRLLQEDINVIPVSFYSVLISVSAGDDGAEVAWQSRFYRADTGNFPSDDQNDEAAVKAMKDFARAGLEGLASRLGQSE